MDGRERRGETVRAGTQGIRFLRTAALGLMLGPGLLPGMANAQTLARPGWRGSGLHAERWWHDVVLLEATPAGDATVPASAESALERLRAGLDDVQALGCDAILLRDVSAPAAGGPPAGDASAPGSSGAPAVRQAAPWNPAWGSIEEFDALLADAGRHRLRLLVELGAKPGDPNMLVGEARFWLSRGVAGIYVSGVPGRAAARVLRPVLRQFVGERVLLGDGDLASDVGPVAAQAAPPRRTQSRRAGAAAGTVPRTSAAGMMPDLSLVSLRGLSQAGGTVAGAGWGQVQQAFRTTSRSTPGGTKGMPGAMRVWHLGDEGRPATAEQARAWVTVLLSTQGGVALRAGDLSAGEESSAASATTGAPAAAAGSAPAKAALREWTERMLALHRGNGTLRHGTPTLLQHDAEGVLVVLWRAPRGPVLVEAVNLRGSAVTLSLQDDLLREHARGTFLRTVLRSDSGMGAMPLGAVSLQPFGVYLGQLSR